MTNSGNPDVSIITISTNQRALTWRCLETIYDNAPLRSHFEVILVDNASSDGLAEAVRDRFPHVRVLVNSQRLGYAANNNLGVRVARGRYPLILNPDIEVLPDSLDALVEFMDANSGVGLCGPKLLNCDLSLQYSCRRFSTPGHLLIRATRLDQFLQSSAAVRDAVYADWDHATPRDVDYVTGAAMIVRREALAQVGLLDEGFTLYFEDQDWCYRMWRQGWRVAYDPASQMIHNHQRASARGLFSKSTRVHARSMVRFFRKHYLPAPFSLSVTEPVASIAATK